MVQQLPTGYVLDLDDPRAPTVDQWTRMSPTERASVVAMLPARLPLSASARAEELEGKLASEHALREEAERRLADALAEIERLKRS